MVSRPKYDLSSSSTKGIIPPPPPKRGSYSRALEFTSMALSRPQSSDIVVCTVIDEEQHNKEESAGHNCANRLFSNVSSNDNAALIINPPKLSLTVKNNSFSDFSATSSGSILTGDSLCKVIIAQSTSAAGSKLRGILRGGTGGSSSKNEIDITPVSVSSSFQPKPEQHLKNGDVSSGTAADDETSSKAPGGNAKDSTAPLQRIVPPPPPRLRSQRQGQYLHLSQKNKCLPKFSDNGLVGDDSSWHSHLDSHSDNNLPDKNDLSRQSISTCKVSKEQMNHRRDSRQRMPAPLRSRSCTDFQRPVRVTTLDDSDDDLSIQPRQDLVNSVLQVIDRVNSQRRPSSDGHTSVLAKEVNEHSVVGTSLVAKGIESSSVRSLSSSRQQQFSNVPKSRRANRQQRPSFDGLKSVLARGNNKHIVVAKGIESSSVCLLSSSQQQQSSSVPKRRSRSVPERFSSAKSVNNSNSGRTATLSREILPANGKFDLKTGRCKKHPSVIMAQKSKFRKGCWEMMKSECPLCCEECKRKEHKSGWKNNTTLKAMLSSSPPKNITLRNSLLTNTTECSNSDVDSLHKRSSSPPDHHLKHLKDLAASDDTSPVRVSQMPYSTSWGESGWYTGEVNSDGRPQGRGRLRTKTGNVIGGMWWNGYTDDNNLEQRKGKMQSGFDMKRDGNVGVDKSSRPLVSHEVSSRSYRRTGSGGNARSIAFSPAPMVGYPNQAFLQTPMMFTGQNMQHLMPYYYNSQPMMLLTAGMQNQAMYPSHGQDVVPTVITPKINVPK